MAKAMLNDVTKCIACRACQVACKQWHDLPAEVTSNRGTYENPPDLSANTWTKIEFREFGDNGTLRWLFRKQQCMHCTDPACVKVCPTGALKRHPTLGFVTYERNKCSGCGYCIEFCPFSIPRMDEHANKLLGTGLMGGKCDFCFDRVSNGLEPACAKACPTGAIKFGERDDLIIEGRQRVQVLKETHPDANLYGEYELGGLHMMYVLDERPEVYGLPENPQMPAAAISLPIEKWTGVGLGLLAGAGMLTAAVVARARMIQEEKENVKE
jgi:formate dehydrogenase iron-sulfur subunit